MRGRGNISNQVISPTTESDWIHDNTLSIQVNAENLNAERQRIHCSKHNLQVACSTLPSTWTYIRIDAHTYTHKYTKMEPSLSENVEVSIEEIQ